MCSRLSMLLPRYFLVTRANSCILQFLCRKRSKFVFSTFTYHRCCTMLHQRRLASHKIEIFIIMAHNTFQSTFQCNLLPESSTRITFHRCVSYFVTFLTFCDLTCEFASIFNSISPTSCLNENIFGEKQILDNNL